MTRVLGALLKSVASQLHPSMLALLLVPFAVAIVFWALAAWFVWDPLTGWFHGFLYGGGIGATVRGWTASIGIEAFADAVPVVFALLMIVPATFATAIAIIAVFSMPAVLRFLSNGAYRDVERRGSFSVLGSAWNAIAATAVFAVGYVVTLPLWLIPPLAFVVPWLWWSWLTARLMRFDSLVEHADPAEREALIARYRGQFFAVGLAVTALNYIPPLFLITPVLAALAYGHFSLALLRETRAGAPAMPRPAASPPSLPRG